MHVDRQPDRGPGFTVDEDIGEDGGAGDVETHGDEEPARDGDRLDGLVDGTGAHALQVDGDAVLYHAGDGTGDGCGG